MAENTQAQEAQWYVVHTYSGYENKVMANLEKAVENNGLKDIIQDVQIPTEEAVEIKNGRRKTVQHKTYPSYVLVKMVMTNESWYLVRNTRGVTGFVGSGNKPIPLSEMDYAAIFQKKPDISIDIEVGNEVRVLSGPFENQTGKVISVDPELGKVQVSVQVLGQEKAVEFEYGDVQNV